MPEAAFRLGAAVLAAIIALPIVSPLACSVPSGAQISQADTDRMNRLAETRLRGLGEAMVAPDQADRQAVAQLFAEGIEAIGTIPDGPYRCRTLKLGGLLPLVVYDFFECEISEHGTQIEKTTGSQRFFGSLTPTSDGLFYQGAQHYNDDPTLAYGDDPERDQVGCLYQVKGRDQYRLELPSPQRESTHDVIELLPGE